MTARWMFPLIVLAALLARAPVVLQGQDDSAAIQVISPKEGAYLAGATTLEARVEAGGEVQSVVFYVDGKQVCAFERAPFECSWDFGRNVDEHQFRVVATMANGRRVARSVRSHGLDYAENVDVDVVQVTATVTDGDGNFVKGLPRSAFKVFEDGREQRISHFESEDIPLDLLVALDISGSMSQAMPKLKEAAKVFLSAVPSKDRVTLLGFNDRVFTIAQNAADAASRGAALDRLAAWGGTALYDVVIRGADMLGRRPGRKALVVFTDGEDESSRATLQDVQRRLQSTDATLYTIGQGRGTSMNELKTIMEQLARPTGGRAMFMQQIDELHRAFAELLEELSNQYLIGYAPTNAKRDGTLRHIKVEVNGKYTVRARQEYRAPSENER